jgi:hypothetical protein
MAIWGVWWLWQEDQYRKEMRAIEGKILERDDESISTTWVINNDNSEVIFGRGGHD